MRCWRALDGLNQEIIGFEAELERLRALQQSREKDRVALDHEMRKLGDDLARTNSRALASPAWSWSACAATPKNRAEQRERNRAAVEEKERLRAEARGGARSRARTSWRSSKARPPPSAKSMPRSAPSWPDWKSATAASAPPWAAWSSSSARPPTAATPSRPRSRAWAKQRARLLADNIELDQKAAVLAEQITTLEAQVNEMAHAGSRHAREPCAPAKRS